MSCFAWSPNLISAYPQTYDEQIEPGFYFISSQETGVKLDCDYQNMSYFIDPKPILKITDFETLEVQEETWPGLKWTHSLIIELNDEVIDQWKETTTKASNDSLDIVFVLDNKIITVLGVFKPITNGVAVIFGEHLSKENLISIKEKIEK